MGIETLLQLNPNIWPVAVLSFLRILSILIWLPILGDNVVLMRVKVLFSVIFAFLLWPVISARSALPVQGVVEWNWAVLLLSSLREVFFGFALGFSARVLMYGMNVASQLVGVNMGFQAASLFNPSLGREESAFTAFQGWMLVAILLALNIHHLFIQGIAKTFVSIPIGAVADITAVSTMATHIVQTMFELAIRIAAPLLLVQTLATLALGLMNRAIPQLNVFVINFPVSFALSMVVLFFTTGAMIRFIGTTGAKTEIASFENMKRAFVPSEGR